MAYADVELMLTGWLAARLGVRAVTELPADLAAVLADGGRLVQVQRFGGGDDELTLDRARVDVDVFVGPDADGNPDRAGALTLGEQVRTLLRTALAGQVINGAVVALVETISAPAHRPWDDPGVRRCQAAYQVTVHSSP